MAKKLNTPEAEREVGVIYPDEHFEKYWKKRQYKHPEEKKEAKRKARIFFYAGFHTGIFRLSKRIREVRNSSQH